MWKIEKFGKSLKSTKFGIILKNIFYRGKMKSGKFLKNMLEFGKRKNLEKSGKKCEKQNLKNFFTVKVLKNMLEFGESGKIW